MKSSSLQTTTDMKQQQMQGCQSYLAGKLYVTKEDVISPINNWMSLSFKILIILKSISNKKVHGILCLMMVGEENLHSKPEIQSATS